MFRAIQDQYSVQVSFRQKQKNFHTTTVVIKVEIIYCNGKKEGET